MSISYSTSAITITDDAGIGPPIVLPVTATPEEVEAAAHSYHSGGAEPDWPRFKRIALGSDSLNAILVSAYQSVPVAAGALAPALMRAESGDHADFAAAWATINRAVAVPPEVVAGFVGVAEACHLPPEFVAALQPQPSAN